MGLFRDRAESASRAHFSMGRDCLLLQTTVAIWTEQLSFLAHSFAMRVIEVVIDVRLVFGIFALYLTIF